MARYIARNEEKTDGRDVKQKNGRWKDNAVGPKEGRKDNSRKRKEEN